jgi:hypothetical protein
LSALNARTIFRPSMELLLGPTSLLEPSCRMEI